MDQLTQMKCVACRADSPRVTSAEVAEWKPQIPDWEMIELEGMPRLQRTYKFKDFRQALDFTNKVGDLAEAEGHHPRIVTEWGKVGVMWWTHAIRGLHRNDFIMSAKTDEIYGTVPHGGDK